MQAEVDFPRTGLSQGSDYYNNHSFEKAVESFEPLEEKQVTSFAQECSAALHRRRQVIE